MKYLKLFFFDGFVVGHAVYGKNMMMACGWIHQKFAGWTSGRMMDEIHGWDMMLKRATQ